jgi:hypothetical protein
LEVLKWLDENHIPYQTCAGITDENTIGGGRGEVYLDVPNDPQDPVFQKLTGFLETPDGNSKIPSVRFFLLHWKLRCKMRTTIRRASGKIGASRGKARAERNRDFDNSLMQFAMTKDMDEIKLKFLFRRHRKLTREIFATDEQLKLVFRQHGELTREISMMNNQLHDFWNRLGIQDGKEGEGR